MTTTKGAVCVPRSQQLSTLPTTLFASSIQDGGSDSAYPRGLLANLPSARGHEARALLSPCHLPSCSVSWELKEVKNQECFSSSVTFFFTSVYNRTQGFFFFFLNRIFKNIFIYFWLCWVFVAARGLSLVAASWGATLHCRPRAQRCKPQQPPEGFQQARPCELS